MNLEVATSVARSRNAPPPAPPDPDALRFWRIKVDAGIDTDSDGTYDWVEFQMAANGTGGMIAGVTGDAFNADTNLDGIPDGLQIDSDEDGTPDATDISPSDNTASFPIGPVPRYALFPITNAEPPTGWLKPIQISDRGTVLYSNGTWTGGTWTPLTTLDNGTGSAFAINDHNHIVGSGTMEIPIGDGNDYRSVGAGCWWESPSAAPETLSVVTEALTLYPNADSLDGLMDISCLPYLSNAGEFLMVTLEVDEEGLLDYTGASLWQLPINNQPVTETAIDAGLFFGNGGMRWGTSNGEPLLTDDAGPDLHPPYSPYNVMKLPGNRILAMSHNPQQSAQVFINGTWNTSPTYAAAIDMAADGIAIERHRDTEPARILLNGKWESISQYAPGVPELWNSVSLTLLDTTPGGWVLAQTGVWPLLNISYPEYAMLLPLRVDGVDPDRVVPPASTDDSAPKDNPPEFLNGGVDHTSMTAMGGTGRVPEIWIMAPNGGASNTVRFQSPLNETSQLTLRCDRVNEAGQVVGVDVDFSPAVINQRDMKIHVSGKKTETADLSPKLKLGGTLESLSTPVKIKAMNKRTVKVAVHKVFGIDANGNQTEPANFPTKEALDNYLNQVYGRQTNTFFDSTMYPEVGAVVNVIDFDENNDGWISYHTNDPEVQKLTVNPKSVGDNATANIDIWVFGGGVKIADSDQSYYGYQIGGEFEAKILIDGNLLGDQSAPDKKAEMLLNTFAHEIGHVMVGRGHANKGDCRSGLYWKTLTPRIGSTVPEYDYSDSRNHRRLMCTDVPLDLSNPCKQLIKKEWDLIEAWLKRNKIGEVLTPP